MYSCIKKFFFIFLGVILILALAGCKPAAISENEQDTGGAVEKPSGGGKGGSDRVIQVGQSKEKEGITVQLDEIILTRDPGLFDPPPAEHLFLYPVFTITNLHQSEDPLYFTSGGSCVAYVDGEEHKRNFDALLSYGGDIQQLDIDVPHSTTVRAMTAFVVPENWKELKLVVNQGFHPFIDPIDLSFEVENK